MQREVHSESLRVKHITVSIFYALWTFMCNKSVVAQILSALCLIALVHLSWEGRLKYSVIINVRYYSAPYLNIDKGAVYFINYEALG